MSSGDDELRRKKRDGRADGLLDPALRAVLEAQRAKEKNRTTEGDAQLLQGNLNSLRARMQTQDRSRLQRLSTLPSHTRVTLVLGITALLLGMVATLLPRADLQAYPPARMALALLSLLGLGLWIGESALRPWQRPALTAMGTTVRYILALALLVLLSALPAAHALLPHTAPPAGMPPLRHALPCLRFGLYIALPVFILCRLLGRASPHSLWMAAATSGLVGNLALQLHCPITDRTHLLAGHATVGIAVLLFVAAAKLIPRKDSPLQ